MKRRIFLDVVFFLFVVGPANAATYTVTSSGDGAAGGTLRWAITNANHNAGSDTIDFNLAAPYTIMPTGELPVITGPTIVSGTNQPGYGTVPLVRLDGRTNTLSSGLQFQSSTGSVVRALLVTRWAGAGIAFYGMTNSRIEACYVMSNASAGVYMANRCSRCWVGGTNGVVTRNVISSNGFNGLDIRGDSFSNTVAGNYIGVGPNGSQAAGNLNSGVNLYYAYNNTIGGTNASCRNVIAGGYYNVDLSAYADSNRVVGNYIGTDLTGSNAVPDGQVGVFIRGVGNVIGGRDEGSRNIISGHQTDGVVLWQSNATLNAVCGNFIGTDASGMRALTNNDDGVSITTYAYGNTIGGTNAGEGNVISGNQGNGVYVFQGAHHNTIVGNLIGLNVAGTAALGNRNWGVRIESPSNTVGGVSAATRNIISGNGAAGIWVDGSNACRTLVYGNYVGTDITGSNAVPNDSSGIEVFDAANCEIGGVGGRGNLVSGQTNAEGIAVYGDAPTATGIVVRCNFIGTDVSGRLALPNSVGVSVELRGTVVGGVGYRNIISGNLRSGVSLGGTGVVVQANYIGTDVTGLAVLSNGNYGVDIWNAPAHQIGGTAFGAGNLICGGAMAGVRLYGSASINNVVEGNCIGADVAGENALGNGIGVFIDGAHSNRIGSANLISGNRDSGVELRSGAKGNLVQVNFIGTDSSVEEALANGKDGVRVDGSSFNWIGGRTNEGNIIAGNGLNGITIRGADSSLNRVFGNLIGCSATLTPLPNRRHGVEIYNDASSNEIGGAVAGTVTNRIAFNSNDGVRVSGGVANAILRNQIFSNGWLGINLGADDFTTNDPGDADSGANNMQNFPVLLSATNNGTQITVIGTIDGSPTAVKRIEYFGSSDVDSSGYGEGENVLYFTNTIVIGPTGVTTFTNRFPTPARPPSFITATATDGVSLDTSEFSYRLILDSDNDGMPDGYEFDHLGGHTNGQPNADKDGDGSSNLAEFFAGTGPGDPASNLRFTDIRLSGDDKALTFKSSATRGYDADRSLSATGGGGWVTFVYETPGTGGAITFTDEWDYAQGYYRLIPIVP